MTEESSADQIYVVTFTGEVLVDAASEEEARQRATEWAELTLAETATVPDRAPIHFQAGTEEADDRFRVPLEGSISRMALSQTEADTEVARQIEVARHTGPYQYITMGAFRVFSGPPHGG